MHVRRGEGSEQDQDQAQVDAHGAVEPVGVTNDAPLTSAFSEPSAEEMRQVRLQRFGLASSGDEPASSPHHHKAMLYIQ